MGEREGGREGGEEGSVDEGREGKGRAKESHPKLMYK